MGKITSSFPLLYNGIIVAVKQNFEIANKVIFLTATNCPCVSTVREADIRNELRLAESLVHIHCSVGLG